MRSKYYNRNNTYQGQYRGNFFNERVIRAQIADYLINSELERRNVKSPLRPGVGNATAWEARRDSAPVQFDPVNRVFYREMGSADVTADISKVPTYRAKRLDTKTYKREVANVGIELHVTAYDGGNVWNNDYYEQVKDLEEFKNIHTLPDKGDVEEVLLACLRFIRTTYEKERETAEGFVRFVTTKKMAHALRAALTRWGMERPVVSGVIAARVSEVIPVAIATHTADGVEGYSFYIPGPLTWLDLVKG